ncbi:MAG: methyltransferase domain-containing protein [Tepidisphaeraceae bacterium]
MLRGAALAPFARSFGQRVRCLGLDESLPMLAAARERFAAEIAAGTVDIREHDLRYGLPDDALPSLTLAVLTLQFVPIEHRQRVVADVDRKTQPGGAMIVVEKILGPTAAADKLLVQRYYQGKLGEGYSFDQIAAKRKSLEGVLVPLTAAGNVAMLEAEGFKVTPFWQHLNFAGWLAVKPKGGV